MSLKRKDKINDITLYKELPKKVRRLKCADHLVRHNNIMAYKPVLCELTHGRTRGGHKIINYVDNLKEDSGQDNINEDDDVGQRCLEIYDKEELTHLLMSSSRSR